MRQLLLAVATLLTLSMQAFAGSPTNAQDIKALSAKLWKSAKTANASVRSQKAELATVYGGEDITHRLSTSTYTG